MRNNDFEFIKDKFENAQLDVPRSLDADIMEKKLWLKQSTKKLNSEKNINLLRI